MKRKYPELTTSKEIKQRLCFLIAKKEVEEFHFQLKQGVNPNLTIQGTPLLQIVSGFSFLTLSHEHNKMHSLLLRYGADPLATNSEGKTAIDLLLERSIDKNDILHPFPSLFSNLYSHELQVV